MLLVKYIRHVEASEGVNFLDPSARTDIGVDPDFFSDGQWEELQKLGDLAQSISDSELAMARDGE